MADYPVRVVEEHQPFPRVAAMFDGLHEIMVSKARDLQVPPFDLTIVATGDMTASVTARRELDFQPERLGGTVTGKTMAEVRDYSTVTIVIDAIPIGDEENPLIDVHRLTTIAHEYGHVLIGRLRAAAGTRPGPPTRMQTPAEAAAILAYEAADEYRCDLFANTMLGPLSVSIDGSEPEPMHLGFLYGSVYYDQLQACLDQVVHPGLANLVDEYRHHRLQPGDMYRQLVTHTDEILKLTAHADAVAAAANQEPVLTGLRAHRGVGLYLDGAWSPIRQALTNAEIIPSLSEFAAVDRDLQQLGQAIVGMWAHLGVRGWLTPADDVYLEVGLPTR